MDNLENFVNENREAFDQHIPPGKIWDAIEQQIKPLEQSKKKHRIINMRWALAAAASVLVTLLVWVNLSNQEEIPNSLASQIDPVIEAIDPGYAVQVKSFNDMILNKQTELKELLIDYPDLSSDLMSNLEQLNKSYDLLRSDLTESPNLEVLLKAMIENLNIQVSILNNQLNLIQQIKKETSNEVNI